MIADNLGSAGAGLIGDATLIECVIRDNDSRPYGDGGGLLGQPMLVDCEVLGNRSGGRGGGLYATGPCLVTGTVFDSNLAGNGVDGYSGGGAYGPATLIGCRITRNGAHHYLTSGPPDTLGTGVDGAAELVGCTVADNWVAGTLFDEEPSGGIRNVTSVVDSILWNNEANDVAVGSAPDVRYSIVGGGHPGTGNLALDPLFLDPLGADYFLTPASPAIDAGDPASPLDPDGTRADLGATPFPQFPADVVPRNGTGANPACYDSILDPVIGSTWVGAVDTTAHGFPAAVSVLVGYAAPLAPLALDAGELLVDPHSPLVFTASALPTGGVAVHSLPVPSSYAFGGLTIHTQAVVAGADVGLCNALDLTLGL